jgi:sec-independent protein translocase protein TatB
MLEVGWSEMLVIAVIMIVVVGPKDLPKMLRTFGRTTAKLRAMAGDFQKQFNEALQEAELDDVKKSVDSLRSLNPVAEIRKQLNPFEKAAADVRSGLDNVMKPSTPTPAEPEAHPAEPLKNGATEMPMVDGPDRMPEPPKFEEPALKPAQSTPVQSAPTTPAAAAEPVKQKAPSKAAAPKTAETAKPAASKKATAAKAAPKKTAGKTA